MNYTNESLFEGDRQTVSDFSVVDPANIPPIAVASMDATHHEEVELVNEIGRLIKASQAGESNREQLLVKLDEWVEHTRTHFGRENQLMEAANFPAYGVHSSEHMQALDGLAAVVDAWRVDENMDALANYVFVSWPEWFYGHVASMDTVTAMYLSQQGVE